MSRACDRIFVCCDMICAELPRGRVDFHCIDLCDEVSVWEHEMQEDTVAVDGVNAVEYPATSWTNNRL